MIAGPTVSPGRLWKPTLVAAGVVVVALGLSALAGWQWSWDFLVHVHPKFAPMHYNTAFAFVAGGLGLLACAMGWRQASCGAASLLLVLGFAELLHAFGAVDCGLGDWWLAPPSGMEFFRAGNPSAASAVCLCLAAASLALMNLPAAQGPSPLVLALLGTVLLFVNLLAALGLPLAFAFGIVPHAPAAQLAFQELAGYALFGAATLAFAFRADLAQTPRVQATPRPWLPLFVGLGGVTVTVLFWQALTAQESQRLQRVVRFEAAQVQRQLVEGIPTRFQTLADLTRRWRAPDNALTPDARDAVDRYVAQQPGCLGVALVAPQRGHVWLGSHDPARTPPASIFTDNGPVSQFVNTAAGQHSVRAQRVWEVQTNLLLVYAPLSAKRPGDGGVVGLYRLRDFLDSLLTFNIAHGYAVALSDGPEEFYNRFGAETADQHDLERALRVTVLDFDWNARVWPTRDVMAGEAFALSKLALVAGFLMSSVLAVTVWLAQTARRRASALEKEIGERTQAEIALKRSEAKYRSLIENLDQSVFLLDRELRYRAVNKHFCRDRGCRESDLLGKTDLDLLSLAQSAKHGEELNAVLLEGTKLVLEEEVTRDGKPHMVHRVLTPVKDDDGQIVGVLGICWDVTEQRTLETHLRQAQKLEAIGQLAGGVAHDFNNLLTALLGNLELALAQLSSEEELRDMLLAAEKAGRRAATLTNQLLSFARQGQMNQQAVNLNGLIDEVVALLSRTIDPRIQLEAQKDPKLVPVLGDPGQLNQVIMNLCLNARDALAGPGRISLETAHVAVDQTFLNQHLEARPGLFVRLRVADTGCGMTPEVRARIFEPFFTTKGLGKGTGLGLATVFGIVKQHQGWIECHSEVHRGTQFDVYFPCATAAAEEPTPVSHALTDSQLVGHETILVVDDEPLIRQMTTTVLTQRGFRVLEAADGDQAVTRYRNEKDHIDLVILDLTMPKLSGQEAFRQLRQINPQVAVLFASGYTTEHITEEEQNQILGFVKKPFRPNELVRTVHGALRKVRRSRYVARVASC
ncbi:MAG: response regulator [Gemmataceae bacterium]|nr:response regulator [Gemmataceae bacterium]